MLTNLSVTQVASDLVRELDSAGVSDYLYTPCGILAPLLAELTSGATRAAASAVSREDTAVALAAGMALGGKRPAVVMQNSGFGNCVNVIASLIVPYTIPVTFVISLRGTGCDDTVENRGMGLLTEPILQGLSIPYSVISEPRDMAKRSFLPPSGPAALLISPSLLGWTP